MAKMKFKVGDIVKPIKNNPYAITGDYMKAGVVTYVDECVSNKIIKIKILKHEDAKYEGSSYSVDPCFFEKIDETIVIYRNENKVIALDKSTGKKAEARCNPADDFDFHVGARIAFERLTGAEKKSIVKQVNRPAKVGEYIKIVNANPCSCGTRYKNGDVFKVTRTAKLIDEKVVKLSNVLGDYILQSEYVVLENYKLDKEEFVTGEMPKGLKSLCECIRIIKEEGLSGREAIEVMKDIILRK